MATFETSDLTRKPPQFKSQQRQTTSHPSYHNRHRVQQILECRHLYSPLLKVSCPLHLPPRYHLDVGVLVTNSSGPSNWQRLLKSTGRKDQKLRRTRRKEFLVWESNRQKNDRLSIGCPKVKHTIVGEILTLILLNVANQRGAELSRTKLSDPKIVLHSWFYLSVSVSEWGFGLNDWLLGYCRYQNWSRMPTEFLNHYWGVITSSRPLKK